MTNFKDGQIIGFDTTDAENPQPITVNATGEDYGFISCDAYDWADSYDADGSEEFCSVEEWLEYANKQNWFQPA
ncbi:hypothetical protein OQJ68_10780 [Microbulbifer thermotolerans]|uniref:Uncharacterized protein n=1 Tax=Microbulbifer thermotolerans TaxID=252514 RepID=A0AB35HY73_MICTH|nr:hypothetical protein [Microbulbifer thermotolerans]MCX2802270.1 hypothetical protein [Microbulbifer thermotolerans]